MKKFIFLILFFGAITKGFACKCVEESIARAYLNADVVALVTIEKTYGEKQNNPEGTGLRTYSADLKFEKIYKGSAFKTLNVFGSTSSLSSGACEKLVEKGERYLIVLSKNSKNEYYVSSCATMPQISNDKYIKDYEDIFKIIDKNEAQLRYSRFAVYRDSSEDFDVQTKELTDTFSKLKKRRLKGKKGIYKVKISDNGTISEITPIQKIGIKEKQIQELMKKNLKIHPGSEFKIDDHLILLEL